MVGFAVRVELEVNVTEGLGVNGIEGEGVAVFLIVVLVRVTDGFTSVSEG